MELKFTKFAAESMLERVLKEEGATDEELRLCRCQVVAYGDDVVSGRLEMCQACKEIQDWFLATF